MSDSYTACEKGGGGGRRGGQSDEGNRSVSSKKRWNNLFLCCYKDKPWFEFPLTNRVPFLAGSVRLG